MKKAFVAWIVLAAVSLAVSGAWACPGQKGKGAGKMSTVAGEVLNVSKDTTTNPKCEMYVATVKTDKGEEKVLLCPMAGSLAGLKAGDQVDLKGWVGPCKAAGKEESMFCAKGGTINGAAVKIDMKACPLMKGKKGMACPAMKDKKTSKTKK